MEFGSQTPLFSWAAPLLALALLHAFWTSFSSQAFFGCSTPKILFWFFYHSVPVPTPALRWPLAPVCFHLFRGYKGNPFHSAKQSDRQIAPAKRCLLKVVSALNSTSPPKYGAWCLGKVVFLWPNKICTKKMRAIHPGWLPYLHWLPGGNLDLMFKLTTLFTWCFW